MPATWMVVRHRQCLKADFFNDLRTAEIPRAPGKDYAYSSTGTELTAHILEQVYKRDYESLLRGFFSDAAGMSSIRIREAAVDTLVEKIAGREGQQ